MVCGRGGVAGKHFLVCGQVLRSSLMKILQITYLVLLSSCDSSELEVKIERGCSLGKLPMWVER